MIVNLMKNGKLPFIFLFIIGALIIAVSGLGDGANLVSEMAAPSPIQRRSAKQFGCLPKDVRADEEVGYKFKGRPAVTLQNKLTEMNARCRRGRLVDSKGREIRFFRLSCWGNPPDNYQEIRRREDADLANLKKRYTVIVFGCNPM